MDTFKYLIVVSILECPNKSFITKISAPEKYKLVANDLRAVCVDIHSFLLYVYVLITPPSVLEIFTSSVIPAIKPSSLIWSFNL